VEHIPLPSRSGRIVHTSVDDEPSLVQNLDSMLRLIHSHRECLIIVGGLYVNLVVMCS